MAVCCLVLVEILQQMIVITCDTCNQQFYDSDASYKHYEETNAEHNIFKEQYTSREPFIEIKELKGKLFDQALKVTQLEFVASLSKWFVTRDWSVLLKEPESVPVFTEKSSVLSMAIEKVNVKV